MDSRLKGTSKGKHLEAGETDPGWGDSQCFSTILASITLVAIGCHINTYAYMHIYIYTYIHIYIYTYA